jgi:hypothetical protein
MFKPLIRLALHINFSATLRTAAKLEYGGGIFCFKLAIRAVDEGYLNLAKYLKEQFAEEDSHARMLGGLVDGGSRLKRNCLTGSKNGNGYEAFDGISQRYWTAKLFFWFKKPEEFSWIDILAFMYVIERFVISFYEVLGESNIPEVQAIALKILQDELEQTEKIKAFLAAFHLCPDIVISKWNHRIILAANGGFIDGIRSLIK